MTDPRFIATGAVVGVALATAVLGRRLVTRLDLSPEQRQRTRNVLRYGLLLGVSIGLLTVWADVVSEAALVASGFAVALVLLHKDLMLNALGWWQKTMSGAYRIGDRVRIGGLRGDVLDYGLLSTTLMEVDPDATHGMRTGNVLIVPNMKLLAEPVLNETLVLGYEWKEFRFTVAIDELQDAETALLGAAQALIAPYQAEVEAALATMSKKFAFRTIEVTPRVYCHPGPNDTVVMTLRLATPARELRTTQDALTRTFIDWRQGSTKP
jgi:small-conductance mechanosensitive channel